MQKLKMKVIRWGIVYVESEDMDEAVEDVENNNDMESVEWSDFLEVVGTWFANWYIGWVALVEIYFCWCYLKRIICVMMYL